MRSLLFVPADSERKLAKSRDAGADTLILDLEDSVAPTRRHEARRLASEFLRARGENAPRCFVRINPMNGDLAAADLAAVMPARPDGIMLPKSTPASLRALDRALTAHEGGGGTTRIIAIATEHPAAVFSLGGYGGVTPRLEALTWGAEDLAAVLGAANRRPDGSYDDVFRLARALCLLGAAHAGVAAIDTVFTDYRDEPGLVAECQAARRAGFTGKMAIHPVQVAAINRAFSVTREEFDWAERVVAAFAANPDAGTVGIDGRMVDQPHLTLARRILERAKEAG